MEAQCEARQGNSRRNSSARLRLHPLPAQRQSSARLSNSILQADSPRLLAETG